MCQVTYFHHQKCQHKWAIISRPCGPTLGFSNCPSFLHGEAGPIKETPKIYKTRSRICPQCLEEESQIRYDRHLVRVVERMGWGLRIGGGGKLGEEWGVDPILSSPFGRHRKMLPTPDTSHVPYSRVYEPAEDSFLLLDTLSSDSEKSFLQQRFPAGSPAPLVVELGTGSGVVLAFANAHAQSIFGTRHILTAGVDMNAFACRATVATVGKACEDHENSHGMYLGSCMGDLGSPWRSSAIDVLVFNPPYVPTPEMPIRPEAFDEESRDTSWDGDSYLLGLAYAGGRDGMETTGRLVSMLPELLASRGCAYLLLCAQNQPEHVRERIGAFGPEWRAEMVASSGKTAGWEKLQVLRIWRDLTECES